MALFVASDERSSSRWKRISKQKKGWIVPRSIISVAPPYLPCALWYLWSHVALWKCQMTVATSIFTVTNLFACFLFYPRGTRISRSHLQPSEKIKNLLLRSSVLIRIGLGAEFVLVLPLQFQRDNHTSFSAYIFHLKVLWKIHFFHLKIPSFVILDL